MALNFQTLRAAILDMDGVLWRGSEVLPRVADFFAFCQQQGIAFALATNNSTKTVDAYVDRLNLIGIPATPRQVITSSTATAEYVSQRYPLDTPIYIIGKDGIREAMAAKGYREDPDNARLVIVGMDFTVDYEKFKIATLRIRGGADFIGTNSDRTFPTPEGLVPGNGSLLALLEAATSVTPVVIGKPETAMFEVALRELGTTPEQTLMIGDRIETDILGGERAGLPTALVLTGTTTLEEARASETQATGIFESLADLYVAWAEALGQPV
jgi:4-nitrophenyl phosphatase